MGAWRRIGPLSLAAGVAGGVGVLRSRARGSTRRRTAEIAALDPEEDHQEISFLLGAYEFPWDFETAMALAFFRTFASPSISGLLDRTGEFTRRPRKRYDDTELLLAEIAEHGYDSARGRTAIRRINRMHGRFDIADEDMLYVMSTFVVEPIRWAERFGWRRLTAAERRAIFVYWSALGPRLGVRGIPDTLDELVRFNQRYEVERFRYAPSNRRVADATLGVALGRLPTPLRGFGLRAVVALLDPHVRGSLGYPDPGTRVEAAVSGVLCARARLLRSWVPERSHPHLITQRGTETYPSGHRIEELGV